MATPILPAQPMHIPRDLLKEDRIGRVKAARVFSNVVSPPVMFSVLGLAFGLYERPFWQGFGWAALYGLLVSAAPLLVVLAMLYSGRIVELHMTNTRERYIPYATAVAFALLTYGLMTWLQGPELLRCLALFNAIELAALGVINVFWLISMHATGIMATFILTGLVFGWPLSWLIVFPFVLAVSGVRLYLKRHTPAQVAAGIALGALSVLSLFLAGCFQS